MNEYLQVNFPDNIKTEPPMLLAGQLIQSVHTTSFKMNKSNNRKSKYQLELEAKFKKMRNYA